MNGWGLPYAAAMCGAKIVFPGSRMDGESLFHLMDKEQITMSGGVPTVWLTLMDFVERNQLALPKLERVVIGGSAAPESLVDKLENKYDVQVQLSWGMTELSPCGVVGSITRKMEAWSPEATKPHRLKPGRAMYGVDMKCVNDEDEELPRDGQSVGRLMVRGPWTLSKYYNKAERAVDADNWFDTGDLATLDEEGFLSITDRGKDVIKSGGEWISSIELENSAMTEMKDLIDSSDGPGAAVMGVPDATWGERPMIIIRPKEGVQLTLKDVRSALEPKVAKWWLPDRLVLHPDPLPLQATGKVWKLKLRELYEQGAFDAQLPELEPHQHQRGS